ncbi:ABC transporter permease [Aquimarina sp. ERC-38]|uniref:ABC transporter permease n=1 Tax=Aquimarina sp. ERC-38 TaxID=2949996 RepID=UPI00224793EB|nr:ABC transporter permease [Aquimarina sp. ERC-38]UZO79999.1 ABC transporter permease [Aquimarina sp. ERC-38]
MLYHFQLQATLLLRRLKLFGISPLLGIPFIAIVFFCFSNWIFLKLVAAPYLYLFIVLFLVTSFSSKKRNDFLHNCYGRSTHKFIRVIENILISLPVAFIFLFQKLWIYSIVSISIAIITGLFSFHIDRNFTIPTPFYKHPFEFILGFRKTYLAYLFVYFLGSISVYVGNFNLCIFSMLVFFFTAISYYNLIEDPYIVWSYDTTPEEFIRKKLKIALQFSLLSLLPLFGFVLVFFFESLDIFLAASFIGITYLATAILLKYAFFPNTDQLPRQLLFFVVIIFPPALLFTIPYFYKKSVQSLKFYLR